MKCIGCGKQFSDTVFRFHSGRCPAKANPPVDFTTLTVKQLKAYAADKGIVLKGKLKAEIIKQLGG